jgi:tripartite-type tricarboxylate transporter receptor subunit TctC
MKRILAALAVAAFPAAAVAQGAAWPVKPVRVIVPFTAGSPVEIPARPVTQRLSEALGQPFLIDNRPGASGTIGTEQVAKAPRDGYTLLYTNCAHSSNPAHHGKLPYDSLADFAPVTHREANRHYAAMTFSLPFSGAGIY